MRLVATSTLQPGSILGKSIYNDKGSLLLKEGISLTFWHIERLITQRYGYVYIKDEETSHIIPDETISEELRMKAVQSIQASFQQIQAQPVRSVSMSLEKSAATFIQLVKELSHELKSHDGLLHILSEVYMYDHYIFTHSLNVTLYSLTIGIEMKLSSQNLNVLGLGAMLHDVGKLKLPEDILFKEEPLTDAEFKIIQRHTIEGFEILRKIHTLPLVVSHCAYQHHERLDGSGYPRGLEASDIHHLAKIIAVADVYDAMTSNRIYRSAKLPSEALEVLYAGSGRLFDKSVVEAFKRSVAIYPIGLTVVLSDGRKGIVARQNKLQSDRPVIEIIENTDGPAIPHYEVDLSQEHHIVVVHCDLHQAEVASKIN